MKEAKEEIKEKKLSDVPGYKAILLAVEEGDIWSLSILLECLDLEKDFNRITEEGKSLQTLIEESVIPKLINDRCLSHFNTDLTPLQKIFKLNEDQTHPPFKHLSVLLKLGADINKEIDQEGNTFLHQYIRRHNVHPRIVTELFLGGGDFLRKNIHGETPLDRMAAHEVRFIKNLMQVQDKENHAATLIQRQWRLHCQKKKHSITMPPFWHLLLNKPVREPDFNPPQMERMEAWIEQHKEPDRAVARKVVDSIQYISHSHFLFGLKKAVKKLNKYLLSLPESSRNYLLVVDGRTDKSNLWVTKLAEKYLAIPPKEIVEMTKLERFIPSTDIEHLVVIDDASYTGNFFAHFLMDYHNKIMVVNNQLMNLKFHLVLPFTTNDSRLKFQKYDVLVHTQETLPVFSVTDTKFRGKTATFFAHKIPCSDSTIECIETGALITGEKSDISFVAPFLPPYKQGN